MTPKYITVKCPATVGNVGPGFDSMGLCLDNCHDTVSMTLIDNEVSVVEEVTGRDAELVPKDPEKNCAVIAAEELLRHKGSTLKVSIKIARELPISGGLGSSAAASVGGALAAAALLGCEQDSDLVLAAALKGEASVAGTHLDNIAPCLFGGLTIVLNNSPAKIQRFPMDESFWHFIVVTPKGKLDTKKARDVLPKNVPTEQWPIFASHSAASGINLLLNNSDGLRDSFKDHFAEPHRKILIPEFSQLQEHAAVSGASGFAISGAGPSLLAVFDDKKKADLFKDSISKGLDVDSILYSTANNTGAEIVKDS